MTLVRPLWGVAALVATLSWAPSVSAQSPAAAAPRYDHLRRPLVLAPRAVTLQYGLGFAASTVGTEDAGAGVGFNASVGLFRNFELEVGSAFRASALVPDRFVRVGREEIYQVGTSIVSNPYFVARYAFLRRRGVQVGGELRTLIPVAAQTVVSWGAGLPIHAQFGAFRVESGLFYQAMQSDTAPVRDVLNVPLRLWVGAGDRWMFGLLVDFARANVFHALTSVTRVSLALAVRYQLRAEFAVLGQLVAPAVEPFGFDSRGVAVAFESRFP
ncbi:MAG: hypothetical protein JNK72_04120 [Myxococcales bacterium]|nr:hypothetical protein [Myxococcales bacterium]